MKFPDHLRLIRMAAPMAAMIIAASCVHGGTWLAADSRHSVVIQEPYGITQVGSTGTLGFSTPSALFAGETWKSMETGADHGLVVDGDGKLYSWGSNSYGQLGRISAFGEKTPLRVGTDQDWKIVAACGDRSAAIKTNGSLWTWGDWPTGIDGVNQSAVPLRVGSDNDWKSMSLGRWHTLALREDGSLWAWGGNTHYSLGDGTNITRNTPVRIGTDNDWAEVACANYTSFAIKTDGSLWVWGNALHGSIYGMGASAPSLPAQPIPTGTGNDWKSLRPSSAGQFVFALKNDGSLWSWGLNPQGSLGQGDTAARNIPTQVGAFTDWQAIAAGESHVIATRANGSIWHWGSLSSTTMPSSTSPADASALFAPVAGMRVFSEYGGELDHLISHWNFPPAIVAEPMDRLLRLRNDGLLPLTISSITLPEGYGISSVPASVAPLQEDTIALHLNATAKGRYTGNIVIHSNRHEIPEFTFQVDGWVVSPDDDTDEDGLNDAAEVAMAKLGFIWNNPQASMVETLYSRYGIAGLASTTDVADVTMHAHPPLLEQGNQTGRLRLEMTNQTNGSPIQLDSITIDSSSTTLRFPVPAGRKYVRLSGGN